MKRSASDATFAIAKGGGAEIGATKRGKGLKIMAQGVYKGRKASIDPVRVKQLKNDGLGPTEIARALKIGRASVYRVLEQTVAGK